MNSHFIVKDQLLNGGKDHLIIELVIKCLDKTIRLPHFLGYLKNYASKIKNNLINNRAKCSFFFRTNPPVARRFKAVVEDWARGWYVGIKTICQIKLGTPLFLAIVEHSFTLHLGKGLERSDEILFGQWSLNWDRPFLWRLQWPEKKIDLNFDFKHSGYGILEMFQKIRLPAPIFLGVLSFFN